MDGRHVPLCDAVRLLQRGEHALVKLVALILQSRSRFHPLSRLQMCADCRVVDMVSAKDEATIFDFRK